MDPYQYRVEINLNVNFEIACKADRSIHKLLEFGSQSSVIETPQKPAVEYMVFLVKICMFKQNCLHQFNEYLICMCTQILLNYLW